MIKKIDHIGIAVKNLQNSKDTFGKLFQVEEFYSDSVESQKVNVASFNIGEVKIELLEPISPDSPIAKFIEKKGEGIHHIAFESDDIKSEIERTANNGFKLINDSPIEGAHEMLIAFLHPKSTNSVLTEICQKKNA
jgi:methylmalonyl-CoA/ethylmalonyl-CoA epimerase